MHLIIGGAYQGKTAYALQRFGLKEQDIFSCGSEGMPDFSAPCLSHMERFVWACLQEGKDGLQIFLSQPEWEKKILLWDDISCGVVPMDAKERLWREATGRCLSALSARAETVTRIFCGLEQRLKG